MKKLTMKLGAIALAGGLSFAALTGAQAVSLAGSKPVLKAEIPRRYDLRDDGYVTPVKDQAPFGTCWAFGGIAAAESSILSDYDLKYSDTVDEEGNGLDLSEKHTAWFAARPITKYDDPKQAGEGVYNISDSPNTAYEDGGFSVYVTSLFSSGTGPMLEAEFPYRGKNGETMYNFLSSMSEEESRAYMAEDTAKLAESLGETLEEFCTKRVKEMNLAEGLTDYDPVEVYLDWRREKLLEYYRENNAYSSEDDWTIPDTFKGQNGEVYSNRSLYNGFTLKNGNLLPEPAVREDGIWKGLNEKGVRAIKQEILNGRGVCVGFRADQSLPGQDNGTGYLNLETWAHYTYEDVSHNHIVCIVGWDDDYAVSKFNSSHRPPANGAWLVKNSWGSETDYKTLPDGSKIGKGDWGIVDENGKHTGYFWLSYYDKSIVMPESMEFSRIYGNQGFYSLQYDYMPAVSNECFEDKSPMRTANIFEIDKDTPDLLVSSVSARTGEENTRVRCSVYRLKKGWKDPMDGTLLYQTSKNFEYAGYHRIEIPKGEQFTVKQGETIAVVNTETFVDDDGQRNYTLAANAGPTEGSEWAEAIETYFKAVVNKGESFVYSDGKWEDWSDVKTELEREDEVSIDNFSIKLFGTEEKPYAQTITAKDKTVTVKGKVSKKTKKLSAASTKASITKGIKTDGNGKLTYSKKSGSRQITVTKDGKVYAVKGTKPGTYKVKVNIKASGTADYKTAQKTVTVTVKVKKK